jgi:hypothetical protein
MHAYLLAKDSPQVFQRCTKVAYPSRRDANKIVRNMRHQKSSAAVVATGSGRISAYKCRICRGWHIGHL